MPDLQSTFYNANAFNVDVSTWDTSRLLTMQVRATLQPLCLPRSIRQQPVCVCVRAAGHTSAAVHAAHPWPGSAVDIPRLLVGRIR